MHGATLHAWDRSLAPYPSRVPPGSQAPGIGDRITVDTGDGAHGGHVVARHDGFVVFVRHALPGERVVAQVTDVRRGFARAEAIEVVRANPDRVEPRCPSFHPFGCGGCDFQHASAGLQHEMKMQVLREALQRHGGLDATVVAELTQSGLRTLGSEWNWRSRMRFSVLRDADAALVLGMHAHRSEQIVPAGGCVIAESVVLDSARACVAHLDAEDSELGADTHPAVEVLAATDGVRTYAATDARMRADDLRLHHRLLVDGVEFDFEVPLDGFWQAQRALVPAIVDTVLEFGSPTRGESWWDLYAGAGPIAAGLAVRVGSDGVVHAVESSARAVESARRAFGSYPWVRVERSDVRRWLAAKSRPRPDGVVLDPPRAGAGMSVLDSLVSHAPRVIVYVACDPVALGRDVALLAEQGYRLRALRAWDAFPQTHHLEAAAVFEPDHRLS